MGRRDMRDAELWIAGLAVVLALVAIVPAALPSVPHSTAVGLAHGPRGPSPAAGSGSRVPVPDAPRDAPAAGAVPLPGAPSAELSVLVSFAYSNASRLLNLLTQLQVSAAPQYHRYLNSTGFTEEFAPPPSVYTSALSYFGTLGAANVTAFPDRLALSVTLNPTQASVAFGTSIRAYASPNGSYLAPASSITLPSSFARWVSEVSGLGTRDVGAQRLDAPTPSSGVGGPRPTAASTPSGVPGYLTPVTVGTVQYVYLPDFQVAYDERGLLDQFGFLGNVSVAAILASGSYTGAAATNSCGTLSSGLDVGPWDPVDVSDYFAETLPSSQTVPTLTPVPVGGAASPGCLASWDTSGQVLANTADLEALGSVTPGASLYGVYGPTWSSADAAFATILSPPLTLTPTVRTGLSTASVISTAYATSDRNDTAWFQDLQQAQARGISVVAATGNAGDNPGSSAWTGHAAEFPSSMAYASFGDLAVGGETVTLSPSNLTIASSTVWNVSAADTGQGGPLGSEGGISQVFTVEPSWQVTTEANSVLNGFGRGIPDLAAVANNSLVTITVDGHQRVATNVSGTGNWTAAMGTGVAASLVAGLLAEIDFVLGSVGTPPVGFFDPALYAIANEEGAPLPTGPVQGSIPSTFNSSLPTMAVRDVVRGANDANAAVRGYDLVTGWGSLDAYNASIYLVSPDSAGLAGRLQAVTEVINLAGLSASTHYGRNSTNVANFSSIQQSVYLADTFGAPIYGARLVVYVDHLSTGWSMNFTGWITFPFNGLYPNLTVSEYWRPAGQLETSLPSSMNLTTALVPGSGSTPASVRFSFGVSGASPLALNVPGAAFIIGATNYSYLWQGQSYANGPKGATNPLGYLAPQGGFEGGPSGGIGEFAVGTSGAAALSVEPVGGSSLLAATTANVTSANSHLYESAANLSYRPNATGSNRWTFAYAAGGTGQGISSVGPTGTKVSFNETGLPTALGWHVNLPGGVRLNAAPGVPNLTALLVNGVYAWTAASNAPNWSASPSSGSVTVSGTAVHVTVTMVLVTNNVTFDLIGPAPPFAWTVVVNGGPTLVGTGATLSTVLHFGAYTYTYSGTSRTWKPASTSGGFTVTAKPTSVNVTFVLVTYTAEVVLTTPKHLSVLCTIAIGNQSRHAYQETFVLHLPNGTYNWSVTGLPAGYAASPSSGTFTVQGDRQIAAVTVTGPPEFGLFGLGIWGYVLVGGVAAAGLAGALVWWRRRRPTREDKYDARRGSVE